MEIFLRLLDLCSPSCCLLLVLVMVLLHWHYERNFFRRRGVRSLPVSCPLLGSMLRVITRKEHFKDFVQRNYNTYPDQKYIGLIQFARPLLMVKDLDLLKQLTIKDFDHFQDHMGVFDDQADPIFGNNLFVLRERKWRDMRMTLSPAFTSSKMKSMFELVTECGEQMINFFLNEMEKPINKERGYLEVEMKDVFTRYTNDVIASVAFGLKMNSFEDQDNEFFTMGKKAANIDTIKVIKYLAYSSVPRLMKMLGIGFFEKRVSEFFKEIVCQNMKIRESLDIVRPDLIQLLMESINKPNNHKIMNDKTDDFAREVIKENLNGKLEDRQWSDVEIAAQAVLFFIAGFDTSSILQCFMAHELTVCPDIQLRLQAEVDDLCKRGLDYVSLHDTKYLNMVVSETLRLWPPIIATDRSCIKPYNLPPPSGTSNVPYKLNVGDGIWIPIYAIHRDPKFHPEPERFDPERFSDENKTKMKSFSYLPFGMGPRNCLGSRFALLEAKAIMVLLLSKFDLVKIKKTQDPLQLDKSAFNLQATNGFWVGLKPRKKL